MLISIDTASKELSVGIRIKRSMYKNDHGKYSLVDLARHTYHRYNKVVTFVSDILK